MWTLLTLNDVKNGQIVYMNLFLQSHSIMTFALFTFNDVQNGRNVSFVSHVPK